MSFVVYESVFCIWPESFSTSLILAKLKQTEVDCVMYFYRSKGALYRDGTKGADKLDDNVPPGGNHTYIWTVPERAGPTADGPNCIPWQYHTHIHAERGTNSGPIGAMIICKQGQVFHLPHDTVS